ncbi:DNA topoisomerase 3 [Cysteiniphilum litorale]|uniref:DNA topoisomerase 3 n=1 Tax=Cysteiniphilum litorale TaxID=2056700 RepID=UPI003F884AC8
MRVFIAEKPSQGRDIARVLGCNSKSEGYLSSHSDIVTWGFGHLLQPADPEKYDERYKNWNLDDLPIIPERWKLSPNPKSKAQLAVVKGLIAKASEVVIATDADREGELIARLILGNARYNGPLKRLWLSALDDSSIKKALSNLKEGSETENLFWAGLGRQRADWLCGMSYSRASTLVFGDSSNVFSVGRVQTPTLRLIVERDIEIENFKPKTYYIIKAKFDQIECDWVVPDFLKGDEEGRCLDRGFAEAVVEKCINQPGTVKTCETKKKEQAAPLPLSLSELQKIANKKHGYDAKSILNAAQALYETHKATTYPRTDCGYLPLSQFGETAQILGHLNQLGYSELIQHCDAQCKSRCWNDKKVSESSHHAIIPTNSGKINKASMSQVEANVYDIIVRYYLAQFMGKYVFNETVIEIICEEELFKTKGIVPVELGWKRAIQKHSDKDQDKKGNDSTEKQLPVVQVDQPLNCDEINIHDKMTTSPSHYTDATLISAMKNCGRQVDDQDAKKMLAEVQGIGTEATRADIIETLKQRSYVKVDGKYIISTSKGREIIKQLPDALTNIVITADWEQKLSEIAKGRETYQNFIEGIQTSLHQNIDVIRSMDGKVEKVIANPCPKCGKSMIRHKSKQGKGYWWGCSGYKEGCDTKMDDYRGSPKAKAAAVTSDIQCPECNNHPLILRTGKQKRKFWACSGYPECKAIYSDNHGKPQFEKVAPEKADKPCPKCGSDLYIRQGKKGKFLGCSAYPKCKHLESA